MSSEHLILHALPAALSPILINLAWKYFLEVGKHFHHAEEETSLKTHHAPPPGMKGACGRSRAEPLPSAHVPRWANVLQTSHPLHTLGQLPHPQSSTARSTQSGHLCRQGLCPPMFCLGVLCSKPSSLSLLFSFFPSFSRKLSFAAGEGVPHHR